MFIYFFALILFLFPAFSFAGSLTITNYDGIEYRQAGNVFTWGPASAESSALRGGKVITNLDISDVEPKATANLPMPYEHKGGDNQKVIIRPRVDSAKVVAKAKEALTAGVLGAASGGAYVAIGSIVCSMLCESAINALRDWGDIDEFKVNTDGSVSVLAPDTNSEHPISDGYYYYAEQVGADSKSLTYSEACSKYLSFINATSNWYSISILSCTSSRVVVHVTAYNYSGTRETNIVRGSISSCPVGHPVVDGQCVAELEKVERPVSDYLQSSYMGKGWGHHWAKMTADIVAAGGNVFTDGTSVEISGPAIIPVSTSETRSSVNLVPGTNTPAPVGHTGSTDPGVQTTTTTTTARNSYSPAPFGSGSGPSMQTGMQTETTTTITNNITNNTTTNNTTVTESDQAPEAPQEDFCQKHPDALACAEMDTPEGEIPRDNVEITFSPEDLGLGNGTCPADRQIGPYTFSYTATCNLLETYGYWLTILLSTFGALVIIFVGKADA